MKEIIKGDMAIRQAGEGFMDERDRYIRHVTQAINLPVGVDVLRQRVGWPVAMEDGKAHITTYFGETNYSDPKSDDRHTGVDIQVPLETAIVAPEAARVVMVDGMQMNELRGMVDILLYSEESALAYWLAHIDNKSLPATIAKQTYFDKWSTVQVERGQILGKVGVFFAASELKDGIAVPEDVAAYYGRSYNHLHFEVHYQPNIFELSYGMKKQIDPLLIVRKLYL